MCNYLERAVKTNGPFNKFPCVAQEILAQKLFKKKNFFQSGEKI